MPAGVLDESLQEREGEAEAGGGAPPPPQQQHRTNEDAVKLAGFAGRESEVLTRLSQGKSDKVVAHEIGVRDGTVKVHVRNIMKKLRAANRTQVVLLARHLVEAGA